MHNFGGFPASKQTPWKQFDNSDGGLMREASVCPSVTQVKTTLSEAVEQWQKDWVQVRAQE